MVKYFWIFKRIDGKCGEKTMKLRRKRVAALVMAAGLGILSVAGGSMTVFADKIGRASCRERV